MEAYKKTKKAHRIFILPETSGNTVVVLDNSDDRPDIIYCCSHCFAAFGTEHLNIRLREPPGRYGFCRPGQTCQRPFVFAPAQQRLSLSAHSTCFAVLFWS